jgi:hypothetical protein
MDRPLLEGEQLHPKHNILPARVLLASVTSTDARNGRWKRAQDEARDNGR